MAEVVVDVEQGVGVAPGIVEHLFGKRTDPPVGQLVAFVGVKVAVSGHEVVQAVAGEHEHVGGMVGVEQVDEVQAEVALEPEHVVVGTVKHFDLVRMGEGGVEQLGVLSNVVGESVDDPVTLSGGELHETDDTLVGAVRMMFEIDGDLLDAVLIEMVAQLLDLCFGRDPLEGACVGGDRRIFLVEGRWRIVL